MMMNKESSLGAWFRELLQGPLSRTNDYFDILERRVAGSAPPYRPGGC